MKRCYVLFLILSLLFASCSDNNGEVIDSEFPEIREESEWDFLKDTIVIAIENDWGVDLLSPERMGNVSDETIVIEYKDKEYKKQLNDQSELSDAFGLQVIYDESAQKHFISFGAFYPEEGYKEERFTLKWEDGTEDIIRFNFYLVKEDGKPIVYKTMYINDNLSSDNSLSGTIVKTDDYPIWDFICYNVCFEIEDAQGNDLLDPLTTGNIIKDNFFITYKDKEYRLIETRFLDPRPLGLRIEYSNYYKKYQLTFGEFTPTGNFKNENFIIHWGDGTEDEITFDLYITWKKFDPTVHKIIYLNGERYSDESLRIKIVKK